jgi:hypothetical protein
MAPEFAGNLYDDALLRDPYPAYLLATLVRHVARIETGEPVWTYNNALQGFERLPAIFHPRRGGALQ